MGCANSVTEEAFATQCSEASLVKEQGGGGIGVVFPIGAKCCSSGEDCPRPVHQWEHEACRSLTLEREGLDAVGRCGWKIVQAGPTRIPMRNTGARILMRKYRHEKIPARKYWQWKVEACGWEVYIPWRSRRATSDREIWQTTSTTKWPQWQEWDLESRQSGNPNWGSWRIQFGPVGGRR